MSERIEVRMPVESQEGTRSMIAKWLKRAGDVVREHEPILEINTDKVSVEIAAPCSGTLAKLLKSENDEIQPGEILAIINKGEAVQLSRTSESSIAVAAAAQAADSSLQNELSPAVRKLLKEYNLTPEQVRGTGRAGRITHQDVMDYLSTHVSKLSGTLRSRRLKHSAMRKEIALHMSQSMQTAPHVSAVFEADLETVLKHREAYKADFSARGAALTLTAYFVQACVEALRAVPQVNSRWHADELEVFEDFNIGIATALESEGLIVPVIERAQELDLFGTAQKLADLTQRARTNALKPSEVRNGTFTISNHGVSGSLFAAPIIINQPQSAILGIGKVEKRPCMSSNADSKGIEFRSKAYVTLTIDHRVLDGFQANKFLSTFVEALVKF